eukprot:757834-Hanusia_phi.AAC.1
MKSNLLACRDIAPPSTSTQSDNLKQHPSLRPLFLTSMFARTFVADFYRRIFQVVEREIQLLQRAEAQLERELEIATVEVRWRRS